MRDDDLCESNRRGISGAGQGGLGSGAAAVPTLIGRAIGIDQGTNR